MRNGGGAGLDDDELARLEVRSHFHELVRLLCASTPRLTSDVAALMLQLGADAHVFALFCSVHLLCDVCLVRMLVPITTL